MKGFLTGLLTNGAQGLDFEDEAYQLLDYLNCQVLECLLYPTTKHYFGSLTTDDVDRRIREVLTLHRWCVESGSPLPPCAVISEVTQSGRCACFR